MKIMFETQCPNCRSWYAKTEKEHALRLRSMADAGPQAKPYTCEMCSTTDWATSKKYVMPDEPRPSLWRRMLLAIRRAA